MVTRPRIDPRGMHPRRFLVLVPAVLLIALISPPVASGAVTLGSDLSTPGSPQSCPLDVCTVVQTALPGRQVTSPIDGVIVVWRVRNASSPTPFRFRVVRPAPGGKFTGGGATPAPAWSCPAICTVNARLPIKAGDFIGADGPSGSMAATRAAPGATLTAWSPFLAEGETRERSGTLGDTETLMNADVEADVDKDGFGDETQDLCPTEAAIQRGCGKATIGTLSRNVAIHPRTGKGKGKVRCTNVPDDLCSIRLTLRAKVQIGAAGRKRTVRLGKAVATVPGGKTATIRIKLSRTGVARLRQAKKLRAVAAGSSRNRAGKITRVRRALTLKVKARKG